MIKFLQMLSVMKCTVYSTMNFVWHTVWFLQIGTEEVWQKILQELGQFGCLWILILGDIMKSCCGCLSQMFVNFSVSHSMWVLCSLWNTMNSCFIVESFEAATIQLLSKVCCHFIQWNIWDGFCVIGCGIYVQFRKLSIACPAMASKVLAIVSTKQCWYCSQKFQLRTVFSSHGLLS